MDERKKHLYYKAGYESFYVLFGLNFIEFILKFSEKPIFTGIGGSAIIIYLAVAYFNVRKSILDCSVPDKDRKLNRIILTVSTILITILFIVIYFNGVKFIEDTGDVGFGMFALIVTVSQWILTIIEWIRMIRGHEKYNR